MAISDSSVKSLAVGLANTSAALEIAKAINNGDANATQSPFVIANLIVATSVSTTTNFGSLKKNDLVLILAATDDTAQFVKVSTDATLPQAAVVGSLYVVLRAYSAPSAPAVKF